MRVHHIPTHFFDNRMVFIHPSRSKCIRTQSANVFPDERIAGLLICVKAAKDTILAADAFYMVFPFFIKDVSLSSRHHIIRCINFTKSKQGTHRTMCKGARNCIFGHYNLYRKSSILFFQSNRIFHLNIVGTRQAPIRNSMTEKSVARSDSVTSSHTWVPGKSVVNSSPKADRK